ncbi:MAG: hypothetical protein QF685_05205 [Verrucomicrobiota bacterium]|nr:hypothetical protein [Verrucomicrobiota bacterium]
MKVALSITLSLVVGAAATGFVLLNQKHSHEEAQQQLGNQHVAALKQEQKKAARALEEQQVQSKKQHADIQVYQRTLQSMRSELPRMTAQIAKLKTDNKRLAEQRAVVVVKEQTARTKPLISPEDIIKELPDLYRSNESAFQRRRIHLTESLVDYKEDSLEVIEEFLNSSQDIEPDIAADVHRRMLDRYGITEEQYVKIQTSISDTLKQKEREARGSTEVEKLRASVEANAKVVLGAEKFKTMQNDRSFGRLISEIGGNDYRAAVGVVGRDSWGRGRGGGFQGQGGQGGEDWRQRMEGFRRNAGGREGIGDIFRQMQGTGSGGTLQERMAGGARLTGVTFNEAPTMRMSLFDVVERIGGARAQGILARQLEITARGAEIVHLDGNLERLTGETYVDEILATTKFVLANPPELDTGMRADVRGTEALWGLLRKYKDDSFVDFAKKMLIDKDGKMHRQANDYLRQFLKDGIMQLYKETYANPDLDDNARRTILEEARSRMGQDSAANAIVTAQFTEHMKTLANPPAEPAEGEEGGRGRRDPAASARGYLEALAQPRDRSAESIAGRKALLGKWRATTSDSRITAMMNKVDEHLTALADPEKAKDLNRFSLRDSDIRSRFEEFRNREGGQRGPGGGQRPGGGKKK